MMCSAILGHQPFLIIIVVKTTTLHIVIIVVVFDFVVVFIKYILIYILD